MSTAPSAEISASVEPRAVEPSCKGDMRSIGTIAPETLKQYPAFDTNESKTEGYIYVLKSGEFYKIGKTVNPHGRFMQISPVMPEPVEVVGLYYDPDIAAAESALHEYFSARRVNGEWFRLAPEDLAFISNRDKTGLVPAMTYGEIEDRFHVIQNVLAGVSASDFTAIEMLRLNRFYSEDVGHNLIIQIEGILEVARLRKLNEAKY
jgi:hypothetical protein